MDVARSARRAAHDVTILALERAEQMPAQREELAEALEEGIALVDGAMLTAVTPKSGSGLSLSCTRVQFEPGATRGQFTVKPVAGSDFELAADAVVVAIGQDADLSALSQRLRRGGRAAHRRRPPGHFRRSASGPAATWPAWPAS